MRGILSSTLFASAALLASCGERPDSSAEAALRVTLLTPGPISDLAWNGEAYRGLLAIRDIIGAGISHIQTRTPASFDENFREYGRHGYHLAIGHGFEYKDAAERIAPASFLAGIAAAGASRTGIIGAIGGAELPPVREGFAAYEAGARTVNPKIRVLVSYVGNWEDVSAVVNRRWHRSPEGQT